MTNIRNLYERRKAEVLGLAAAGLCLVAALLLALALVRSNAAKSQSVHISDDYTQMSAPLEPGQSASQTFSTDEDLLALGFVFGVSGGQPTGALELTLADAATGEVLARSTGEMGNIIPGQYTTLGLDTPVPGEAGRQYLVTLTPQYTGEGRLCVGYSDGATLWNDTCTIQGSVVDGTLALLATTRRIGGFLTRFFLIVSVLAAAVVFCGVRAAVRGKIALPRLVFGLVLAFGLLYSVVLPPYAAPDEKYHINQSFTLACRWANLFSDDEWRMGNVPIDMSYRREHDVNPTLQDENTTVFTWQEWADELLTRSPDAYDSHVELAEYQTDRNPLLYLVSAAGVFIGFVLRLGFVPTLMLGRLGNLMFFAAMAALAVRHAPFGRRVFAAAALLPMTLHLAASFSRDAVLLGLAFAFTALCLEAVFGGEGRPMRPRDLIALAACGILLAPAKVVYLPLAALFLLIPNLRLGARPVLKKAGYAAACLLLMLSLNSAMLANILTPAVTESTTSESEPAEAAGTADAPTADGTHAAPAPQSEVERYDYYQAMPEEYKAHTTEAFVRRLYYCTEPDTQVLDSEVDFWVQALEEGDVTAAELGQSFLFSPTAMEENTLSDDAFLQAGSLIYQGYNAMATPEVAAYLRDMLARQGRSIVFKSFYSGDDCKALMAECGITVGTEDPDAYPLDRATLVARVEEARAVRASQSTVAEEDQATYTPGYVLTHLPATVALVVRSVVADTDDAIRGLVGGLLSYNSLELAWGWVLALYVLLGLAALPVRGGPDGDPRPEGRYRVLLGAAALGCAALTVAGCIVWTPLRYDTIYGFQGRYLLPVLPLALLALGPRRVLAVDEPTATARLMTGLCLVQAGVLLNIMLAVIAR